VEHISRTPQGQARQQIRQSAGARQSHDDVMSVGRLPLRAGKAVFGRKKPDCIRSGAPA
jgi:hypothetical protein